jgi:N6-adenosine-specific RNA methylase IME4
MNKNLENLPPALNTFPPGQFGVLYADPPWQYKMYSDKGYEKSPDVHYDCMMAEQMEAMRDQIIFATSPNAVCFMWAVWPMLDTAMKLMAEWGFKYKTGGAWHKRSSTWEPDCDDPKSAFGTGYILRSACEPFLIGTIGEPNIKNKSTRNIIEAAVREHSRKPDEVIPMLENLFDGPYLELFSRQQRLGWSAWGNQTDKFTTEKLT